MDPRQLRAHPQADFPNLMPAPNSDEIEKLTAGRRPEGPSGDGQRTPWISYAEMADFITR